MRLELKARPQQRAEVVRLAGCAVVFASAPELSGTYALDPVTLDQIGAVARDAGAGLGLPFGANIFVYPDRDGQPHAFDAEQVQALYRVLRDYTAALQYFSTGQTQALPANPVTIP